MTIVLAGHILGLNQIGPQCRIFLMCWFVSLLRIKQKETDHHWTILVWIVDTFTVLFRVCLDSFAKTCKDVNKAFEVLNKVYL